MIEKIEENYYLRIPEESIKFCKYPEVNMSYRGDGWMFNFVQGIWYWSLIWLRKKILKKDNF